MKFTLTAHVKDSLVDKLSFELRCSKAKAKLLIKKAFESRCNEIQMKELYIWDRESLQVSFDEPNTLEDYEMIPGAFASVSLAERGSSK